MITSLKYMVDAFLIDCVFSWLVLTLYGFFSNEIYQLESTLRVLPLLMTYRGTAFGENS